MDNKDEFSINDLRKLDEETIIKDIKRGYDLENCKIKGKDESHQIQDKKPFKKKMPLIYVKLEDHSFRFSMRPYDRQPNIPNQRIGYTLSHSLLAKGKPVIGAGECDTDDNGNIILVNNKSGHYKPLIKNLRESMKNMKKQGLVVENTEYYFIDGNTKTRIS